jgi:hypothetical protein
MKILLSILFAAVLLPGIVRADSDDAFCHGPPIPSYGIGGAGFVLAKDWTFGTNGTIKNIADMNKEFQYHDQFNTTHNPNYGAMIVAPDSANALSGQPIEGKDTAGLPVRAFFADYMQTYLVPLKGATTVSPGSLNTGSGSFQAKWTLPNGGSLLGHDIIWETRVRYVTPPYFWFALWTSGNHWNNGAEMDVIESFGFDNGMYKGLPNTNYDGHVWHSDVIGGTETVSFGNWWTGMGKSGVHMPYDATSYHVWTWLYKKDNTFAAYVDGLLVQSGTLNWTVGGKAGGVPINMSFLFDGTWGSWKVWSVNHPLPAAALAGKYYEWNYSRVFTR